MWDVRGRLVRTLRLPAAAAEVAWDGRDDAGHPVPAGAYFVRLRTREGMATHRLVRLR
ncbi:hypothetical protein K8I85_15005 [bacterium]|nr:hypothetical protein [bacterium]